jgi:16S rRNA (cytosine1402-N4)-methyltransferase
VTVEHRPVMVQEVIDFLRALEGGVFVDATFGGGGHTRAILRAHTGNRVVALDRDPEALKRGPAVLREHASRVELLHMDFRRLPELLARRSDLRPDGLVADLGVSSLQLLDPARGFAFARTGPLDMRLDRTGGQTAADLVNSLPEKELRRLITRFGEERQAGRIARAIVRRRERRPFSTTTDLADVVRAAVPARDKGRIDAATRTFQALRIAVNDELTGLGPFVRQTAEALPPGARLVFISFHSLEDRPIKETLRRLARPCVCPPDLPVCGCGRTPLARLLTSRARRPAPEEVNVNPAARSARLRAAERIAA